MVYENQNNSEKNAILCGPFNDGHEHINHSKRTLPLRLTCLYTLHLLDNARDSFKIEGISTAWRRFGDRVFSYLKNVLGIVQGFAGRARQVACPIFSNMAGLLRSMPVRERRTSFARILFFPDDCSVLHSSSILIPYGARDKIRNSSSVIVFRSDLPSIPKTNRSLCRVTSRNSARSFLSRASSVRRSSMTTSVGTPACIETSVSQRFGTVCYDSILLFNQLKMQALRGGKILPHGSVFESNFLLTRIVFFALSKGVL